MESLARRFGQTVQIHRSSKIKLLILLLPQDGTSVAGEGKSKPHEQQGQQSEHLKQQSLRRVHSCQLVIALGLLLEATRQDDDR
jgi:hypothetical protein